jgi:hypothetical protein
LVKKNLHRHLYTLYSIQISVRAPPADLACAHSQGDNGTLLVPRQSVGLKPPHDKEEVIIPEQVITEYRPFAVEATTKPASSGDS